MGWRRRGLLLAAPPPVTWAASHAALPIVRVRADGSIDLYFSSRDVDGRSHVARGALDLEQGNAVVEPQPVLSPGPLGAFDDSGVTTSSLLDHDGALHLYFTGWTRGVTVPFGLFAGCAVSRDGGRTFEHPPAPLLDRSRVDPFLTASPWVLIEDGIWRMWYVSGIGWERAERSPRPRYHLKYAESENGVDWRREGRACVDFAEGEYALSRPCVLRDGDVYRMWFSARGDAYRICYAESRDGLVWERHDDAVDLGEREEWDAAMQAYPLVFDRDGKRTMLWNGNGYGATGIGWAELER